MSLAEESQILAVVLWLALLLGPPLALSLLAPMVYVDGAGRYAGIRYVRADNRAVLLLLLISFTVWLLLLKYIYLPAAGFDTDFLTLDRVSRQNYRDLHTLQTLGTLMLAWVRRTPFVAGALLAVFPLAATVVLWGARAQGRAAAQIASRAARWHS